MVTLSFKVTRSALRAGVDTIGQGGQGSFNSLAISLKNPAEPGSVIRCGLSVLPQRWVWSSSLPHRAELLPSSAGHKGTGSSRHQCQETETMQPDGKQVSEGTSDIEQLQLSTWRASDSEIKEAHSASAELKLQNYVPVQ
ncbi:hypothetical protein GN956_G11876 [Arapaima gigas]